MILVTGGNGLVGSYLLLQITKNNDIVYATKKANSNLDYTKNIFRHFNLFKNFNKIIWVDCDLNDLFDVNRILKKHKIDIVYHCAASVSYKKSMSNFIIENNVEITRNIVDAGISNNIKALCHVSSIAALGSNEDNSLITEKTLWKDENSSAYSKSKYLSELEVWRGISEGLNAVIIQPSVVLGGGFWHKGIGSIFNKIKQGMRFYTEGSTSFVDVRDVVAIMIELINKKIFSDSFILNSENYPYKDFFHALSLSLNSKPPYIKADKKLLEIAWRLEYVKSIILNSEPVITSVSAKTALKKLKYDNSKIKKTLNFNFIPVNESINYYSNWFEKEKGN